MHHVNKIILNDLLSIIDKKIGLEKLYDKTILVAGANSFLAAYIIELLMLLNRNCEESRIKVIAMVRNYDKGKNRYNSYLNSEHFKLIKGDVTLPNVIDEPLSYIIHAASLASPKYYKTDPVGIMQANMIGTDNLLKQAVKNNVNCFLFFSSSEIYGQTSSDAGKISEDDFGPLDSMKLRSCYAESKRAGETLCKSYEEQYGVKIKIVRPFHTYGPGMDLDDGRVFADFVRSVVRNEDIEINSDGKPIRAFCYLKDSLEAFMRVLIDGIPGEAYNVGNDKEAYSIGELAEIVTGIYPEKKIRIRYSDKNNPVYLKSKVDRIVPDISKIKGIGFNPEINAKEGFYRTIESYLTGDAK